ncbi:hypothetical protein [Amycolatopsis anabasis]|uniref:hypothetical protein n=1 Tax=Amycolatopsis anabasis TaxID=1840409 RepID=UPI00131E02FA|nr:hypothetical protein [Amycolatopsis anabasis]
MRSTKNGVAWRDAVDLERKFSVGTQREPIPPPPALQNRRERGEYTVAEFSRLRGEYLRYERFESRAVQVTPGGPAFAAGSPEFVGGFLIGTAMRRIHRRRKARAMAAPQWYEYRIDSVVVTTHRLWCLTGGDGPNFNYDLITNLTLLPRIPALTLSFLPGHGPVRDLRISGEWAPWIAVAVAYYTYGTDQARQLPTLAPLRETPRPTTHVTPAVPQLRNRTRR